MAKLTLARFRTLLPEASIVLDAAVASREEAVALAGSILAAGGAVDQSYADAMLEREYSVSTYVGEGIAMPHGTLSAKDSVISDALVLLRFTKPIDWNGESVSVVIGIAARGRGYIALISQLAAVLLDSGKAADLRAATTADEVYAVFA